jgi:hypothetical protein
MFHVSLIEPLSHHISIPVYKFSYGGGYFIIIAFSYINPHALHLIIIVYIYPYINPHTKEVISS